MSFFFLIQGHCLDNHYVWRWKSWKKLTLLFVFFYDSIHARLQFCPGGYGGNPEKKEIQLKRGRERDSSYLNRKHLHNVHYCVCVC